LPTSSTPKEITNKKVNRIFWRKIKIFKKFWAAKIIIFLVHDSSDLADLNYDQSMESSISVTPTAIETSEMETDTSLQNLEDLFNDDF
jgi:hypothetical protein